MVNEMRQFVICDGKEWISTIIFFKEYEGGLYYVDSITSLFLKSD